MRNTICISQRPDSLVLCPLVLCPLVPFRLILLRLVLLSMLLSVFLRAAPAHAQNQIDIQYQVKAQVLLKLVPFIVPLQVLQAGSSVRIGVLGPDPFDGLNKFGQRVNHLDVAVKAAQTIAGRPISVARYSTTAQYEPCHVLFISPLTAAQGPERTAQQRLDAALLKVQGTQTLLVADTEGFAAKGVVLNFYLDEKRLVRIELNPAAARKAGLQPNAGLLRIARVVQP